MYTEAKYCYSPTDTHNPFQPFQPPQQSYSLVMPSHNSNHETTVAQHRHGPSRGTVVTPPHSPLLRPNYRKSVTTPPPSPRDWLRSAMIKRTLSFIKEDSEAVLKQSGFLQQPCHRHALLHRSEIVTGRLLGRGGFSHVYEVAAIQLQDAISVQLAPEEQHERCHLAATCLDATGRPRYAIKQLQERLLESRKGPKEFQYAATDLAIEAAFLSRLQHENIVACRGLPIQGLDAWAEKGHYDAFFIVMDLAHDTLDHRIHVWEQQSRELALYSLQVPPTILPPPPIPTASSASARNNAKLQIALQVARALEHLHSHRIVFRDLKPSNVGLVRDSSGVERALLMDFGLCRELPTSYAYDFAQEDESLCEVFEMSGVGTRRYMAVEIVNTNRYNCKADVYSWSILFWELLSHNKPFAHYSMEDHREYVCQRGVRPRLFWEDWSESLCHLLQASWDEDVSIRLTMAEAASILQSLLASEVHLSSLRLLSDATSSNSSETVSSTEACQSSRRVLEERDDDSLNSLEVSLTPPSRRDTILANKEVETHNIVDTLYPFDRLLTKLSMSFDCGSTAMSNSHVDFGSHSLMSVSMSSVGGDAR